MCLLAHVQFLFLFVFVYRFVFTINKSFPSASAPVSYTKMLIFSVHFTLRVFWEICLWLSHGNAALLYISWSHGTVDLNAWKHLNTTPGNGSLKLIILKCQNVYIAKSVRTWGHFVKYWCRKRVCAYRLHPDLTHSTWHVSFFHTGCFSKHS